MEKKLEKIGFGGGCHWCTEAIFQSLKGVTHVRQGWMNSHAPNDVLSEAVEVCFDPQQIHLHDLMSIHLYTHSCTSDHSLRLKYRSAAYYFEKNQIDTLQNAIDEVEKELGEEILTKILPFVSFKENEEKYRSYFKKNPDKPFCQTYILPKFQKLMTKYAQHLDDDISQIATENA